MTCAGNNAQRDRTFDIMKGIGILLVITAHYFSWNHPILGRSINSFHMPMFFIVAGYFSKSFTTWSDAVLKIKRYARRLLPAFVFTQILIVLWAVMMAFTQNEGWGPVIQRTLSLFWADPHGPDTPWGRLSIGVIWFLVALWVSKSFLLILSRIKVWAIPVSFTLAIVALLLHRVFPYSIWCLSIGLTALPFVTLGWWFRTHKIPVWLMVICLLCWIAAILYSKLVMYDFIWGCYPLDVLGACGGTLFLYWISKMLDRYLNLTPNVLSVLGIWSLAIMCFHHLEMDCHLGNHVMALFPVMLPLFGRFFFRFLLTVGLAGIAVNLPVIKKIFV